MARAALLRSVVVVRGNRQPPGNYRASRGTQLRILAIETSGTTGSVAAFDDSRALAFRAARSNPAQARTLAPAIAQLVKDIGWKPREVQTVAVGIGPGSFTGLRLG